MLPYTFVDTQNELDKTIKKLLKVKEIAIDTESSGFYTYFPELCLIQISAENNHFIIDPLVNGINLNELGLICEDESILKIFHSAYSDMLELKRAYNWKFKNIFDTFLACRFLGHATCSLSSLVLEYEGIELEKKEQKSNWQKRPLSKAQLDYAHTDTVYLESIKSKLLDKLIRCGVFPEVKEEFERLCYIEVEAFKEENLEGWRRLPDVQNLSIEQQAMLRELYILRDKRARIENIAAFRLLPNPLMVQLIKDRPDNLLKPSISKSIHPAFIKNDSENILKIIKGFEINTLSLARDYTNRNKIGSESKNIVKKLKKWRNKIAEIRGIDLSMVVNTRNLEIIATKLPKTIDELQKLNILSDWKLTHYGQNILDIISGSNDSPPPVNLPKIN